jgi:hypothetical protein
MDPGPARSHPRWFDVTRIDKRLVDLRSSVSAAAAAGDAAGLRETIGNLTPVSQAGATSGQDTVSGLPANPLRRTRIGHGRRLIALRS